EEKMTIKFLIAFGLVILLAIPLCVAEAEELFKMEKKF
ncbi:unnamed protein product, partial [Onchocerca ochengi]|uniref:Col_cuticle_N domain-containing protein n=1 Tax=Onchocerca ochengi TaxID=42157 RepID=A0A182F0D8_ONCOC